MSCHALDSAAPGTTPFSRYFSFEWYDGPVSGLVECEPGGAVFAFRMVAWDGWLHQRIYVLQPTSAKLFDRKPLAHEEEEAWARYEEILRSAGPIEYVVLADEEIPGPLRSIHRVGEGAVRERIEAMMVAVGLEEDFVASEHTYDEWVALLRTIP
jgi:hypothetical protein